MPKRNYQAMQRLQTVRQEPLPPVDLIFPRRNIPRDRGNVAMTYWEMHNVDSYPIHDSLWESQVPASRIHVQYSDGSSAKGVKVEMSINGASCKGAFVDSSGVAVIEHSSTGMAKVYIHGKKVAEFRAPGKTAANVP